MLKSPGVMSRSPVDWFMKLNKNFKEILESALKLDDKQRAELAKRLLESLESGIDGDVEQAWLEETERRKGQIESGEVRPIPAEDVIRKARGKINK